MEDRAEELQLAGMAQGERKVKCGAVGLLSAMPGKYLPFVLAMLCMGACEEDEQRSSSTTAIGATDPAVPAQEADTAQGWTLAPSSRRCTGRACTTSEQRKHQRVVCEPMPAAAHSFTQRRVLIPSAELIVNRYMPAGNAITSTRVRAAWMDALCHTRPMGSTTA